MIIPSYIKHESYIPIDHPDKLRIHDDRLVFRLKDNGKWTNVIRTVTLSGPWFLEDKIIKEAGSNTFDFSADRGCEWHGPFIDSSEDCKVNLPPWESFEDFKEVLSYLSMTRKPYFAIVETREGEKKIKGRAKDVEEFKHLYFPLEETIHIIELSPV